MDLGKEYLRVVKARFRGVKELGDKTISQLDEEDMHWALNDASNSMAVIIKHMSGNMISRWSDFLTTDGEKAARQRDQEFEMMVLLNRSYWSFGKTAGPPCLRRSIAWKVATWSNT